MITRSLLIEVERPTGKFVDCFDVPSGMEIDGLLDMCRSLTVETGYTVRLVNCSMSANLDVSIA